MCLAETKSERDRAHQYKNCLAKTLASISRTHGWGHQGRELFSRRLEVAKRLTYWKWLPFRTMFLRYNLRMFTYSTHLKQAK